MFSFWEREERWVTQFALVGRFPVAGESIPLRGVLIFQMHSRTIWHHIYVKDIVRMCVRVCGCCEPCERAWITHRFCSSFQFFSFFSSSSWKIGTASEEDRFRELAVFFFSSPSILEYDGRTSACYSFDHLATCGVALSSSTFLPSSSPKTIDVKTEIKLAKLRGDIGAIR